MKMYAVLLAAGFSTRMAPAFKPLLALPFAQAECSLLAHLILTYTRCGIQPLVVTGHHANATAAVAQEHHVAFVHNPTPEKGMFSSICTGVAALPTDCTHFFVHPVDIPLVRPMTLYSLSDAVHSADAAFPTIYIPTYKGNEGHPPLFDARFKEPILAWTGDAGLHSFIRHHSPQYIPVADANILLDADTPEDMLKLRALAAQNDVLTPEEGEELLTVLGQPPRGQNHCRAVAAVAEAFASQLNKARLAHNAPPLLDLPLVRVGGMVHDMCKGQKHHEAAAGALFTGWHMERMAWLVASHRDLTLPPEDPITEREIVFLADKYVQGPCAVSLEARFAHKLDHYAKDSAAQKAICGRRERAAALAQRFARESGCDPAQIAARTLVQPQELYLQTDTVHNGTIGQE